MAGASPDEAAGDTGGTQPKCGRYRLRTGFVLPTGQATSTRPEQAGIRRPRDLQPFVRGQRDRSVRDPIVDERDRDGPRLIGEIDRAWLLPPADHGRGVHPSGGTGRRPRRPPRPSTPHRPRFVNFQLSLASPPNAMYSAII